jgi:hypothetical protein
MPKEIGIALKGILLVVGAYVVTIVLAAFSILLTIMLIWEHQNCSTMNGAVIGLWVTIAVLFLASIAVVRIVARRIIPGVAGRLAAVATYGVVMLASYVVIAFGLLVAFEC